MLKRTGAFFVALFIAGISVFLFHGQSYGYDTDLYTITSEQVPPNVMIILDNSSSMANEDQPLNYDPSVTYSGSYVTSTVYQKLSGDWVFYRGNCSQGGCSQIQCDAARTSLLTDGFYNGKLRSDTTCGGGNVYLQLGNYMNYLTQALTSNQPRIGLATGTIHSYVNSTEGINFGLMTFNNDGLGGRVTAPVTGDKNVMFAALSNISTARLVNWTPLAETLYEGMLYFKGASTYYNSGQPNTNPYTSPIQYSCQKSYVIIITDGVPTYDVADEDPPGPIATNIGDYDGDGREPGTYGDPLLKGSHYLDDIAKYINTNDLRPDLQGFQNLTIYTIGFNPTELALDSQLLESTAKNGGGGYFYAHNSQEFKEALQSIIEEILGNSISFVAPTVPISQMEKTTSVDRIYLSMFKAADRTFWWGNVKKFGIATANNPSKGVVVGDIIDKNGDPAIEPSTTVPPTNEISGTAVSYWSTDPDGGYTEKGGVGEILKNRDLSADPRKIYTYLGTNALLTHPSNAFTSSNISSSALTVNSDADRDSLISFIYGYDAYNQNNTSHNRAWILGGIVHSRATVAQYSDRKVIFVGANDGMLHAFDDSNGRELWAFIPRDQLTRLKLLTGNSVQFFVDGSPKIFESSSQKILVFGERRGGSSYFALDVTSPESPLWLWQISPDMATEPNNYSEMGQSWSTPMFAKVRYGTTSSWTDKWVMFIGGGYDTNQDDLPVTRSDTQGRAVYVVDVLNGNQIKRWQYDAASNPSMTYSIPSDIAKVDTDGNGWIDRLYVGDTGGQMWRFDLMDPSPTNWTAKCIFNANDPPPALRTDRRKIFYPPDVGLEKDRLGDYELVIFGTGDREHPKETAIVNRLYTVKDRNPSTVLKEADLVDVTQDYLQTGSSTLKQQTYDDLMARSGWFIILGHSGEKCLSAPLLFYRVSYFSTFTPEPAGPDPCYLGKGTARLYAVAYLTGNAVFNFDTSNDSSGIPLQASDRSEQIGTAIPSGVVIAIVGGTSGAGYVGIGGGIYKAPLKSPKVIVPINWKERF